jgi:hypothetical protein
MAQAEKMFDKATRMGEQAQSATQRGTKLTPRSWLLDWRKCQPSLSDDLRAVGNPGQGDPGQGRPGQGNPGQGNPGQGNPGQGDPGQGNPGRDNPSRDNPGETIRVRIILAKKDQTRAVAKAAARVDKVDAPAVARVGRAAGKAVNSDPVPALSSRTA